MSGDWNFATCWEAIADARPDATALIQGNRRVSWSEFEDRSARLARAFSDLGIGPEAKVASYLYNCSEYLEGTFATWKLRAAPVNVNYRYLEDELLYLLDNSDAEMLLFHGVLAEQVAGVRDRAPKLRAVVQVDDGSPLLDGAIAYEDLVAGNEPAERITRSGDDLYILYTGGTTGMPKGVMWRNDDLFVTLMPTLLGLAGETMPDTADDFGPLARRVAENGRTAVHLPGVTADARHRLLQLAPGTDHGRHDRDARTTQLRRRRALDRRCA